MEDTELEANGSCSSLPIISTVSLDEPPNSPEPLFSFSLNREKNNITANLF